MHKKPADDASPPIAQYAEFETEKASRYLQQLLKHFAHKIEVEFTETEGRAVFEWGEARLKATDERLEIAIDARTSRDLVQTRYVIEEHLLRFAFRENPGLLDWRTIEPAGG